MNAKEHKKYLEEFKEFAKDILDSEESAKSFLIDTGINTKTGRLTKQYSHEAEKIGFKINEKK